MGHIAKYFIIGGGLLIAVGLILLFKDRIPLFKYLGNLPGDFEMSGESFRFYFPLTSSLIISVLLSLVILFSSMQFGSKDVGANLPVSPENPSKDKALFAKTGDSQVKMSLPEVEAIIDLKMDRGKIYLSRDDFLVDLSLFVPSSGQINFEEDLQSGRMVLRDGSVIHIFMPSKDIIYLVPEGNKKEEGQLFIKK